MLRDLELNIKEFSGKFGENSPKSLNYERQFIRWGKNNHLWAIGHKWAFQGEYYAIFHVGSWKNPAENQEFKSWDTYEKKPKEFYKKVREEERLLQYQLEVEKKAKNKNCIDKWLPIYEKSTTQQHPYLIEKGVKPFNTVVTEHGELFMPIYQPSGFVGGQRIFEQDGKFVKRFTSGLQLKGAFSPLSSFKNANYCYVAEGLATGAIIQEGFPNVPVIVCLNAGNILHALVSIREINPDIKIIIAADRDLSETGKKYAKIAARRLKNVIYILPKFKNETAENSDFNDLYKEQNLEEVKRQLRFKTTWFEKIIGLGVNDGRYYYYSSNNPEICSLKAAEHKQLNLYSLNPDDEYWKANYEDAIILDENGEFKKLNFTKISAKLMKSCHDAGIFEPKNVRGTGIFTEKDPQTNETKYVVNDGQRVRNQPEKSKYYYIRTAGFNIPKPSLQPITNLLAVLNEFETEKPVQKAYLMAWAIQSNLFSARNWRFQTWLTGPRGSGKSTILKFLNKSCPFVKICTDTSAAGLTQYFASNQQAILYDEMEPTNRHRSSIIDLAREMATNGSNSFRGTVGGKAIHHRAQLNFMFASVQTPRLQGADVSRFVFIHLKKLQQVDLEKFKKMEKLIENAACNNLAFFSWAMDKMPYLEECETEAKQILISKNLDARQADTISAVIACLAFLNYEKLTPAESVKSTMLNYDFIDTDYAEDSSENDSIKAMNELFNVMLDPRDHLTVEKALVHCVEASENNPNNPRPDTDTLNALHANGLHYVAKKHCLFVHHKNLNLARKMKAYPKFYEIIHRDTDILTKWQDRQKILGSTKVGYAIDLSKFIDRKIDRYI